MCNGLMGSVALCVLWLMVSQHVRGCARETINSSAPMELWEHMGTCAGDLHMMGGFGLWFFLFSMTKPNVGFWFDSRPWIRWCCVLEIWLNHSLMKCLWGFSSCNK